MGEVFWQRDVALINILSDLGPHAGPRKDQGGQGTQHLGQARVETTTAPHSGRLKHPGLWEASRQEKSRGWLSVKRGVLESVPVPEGCPGFG